MTEVNNSYAKQDGEHRQDDVNKLLARCTRVEAALDTCADTPANAPASGALAPVPDSNNSHFERPE